MAKNFPIPSALHDLERAPYNLLPYPEDFDDDDEAARAESFDVLVLSIETSNRTLANSSIVLFESDSEGEEAWNNEDRMQALYTLVRKSSSIAGLTKKRLIDALCKSVHSLCRILVEFASSNNDCQVSQEFRAAFAFQLYMLFSVMFLIESEAKGTNGLDRRADNKVDNAERDILRACCAQAMLTASQAMCKHRSYLWQRGVPDEAVALLPCRISYQMLESATGVVARKAASGDAALEMLAATIDSSEHLLNTIVAALVDLLHAYEHIAPLVAELCCMVNEIPTNRLAVDLIREIGRLNPAGGEGAKASGIRNLTPFISELARMRPRIVLTTISQILPHLNSEPYSLRSAIVTAIGHILVYIGTGGDASENEGNSNMDLTKSQNALLDILCDRALDVSSFTRGAVLKAWISIVSANALPIDRLMSVTTLAADRLRDKTVVVRRSAMQLLTALLEHNPFLGSLDPKPYRSKLGECYEMLKATMPEDLKAAQEAARLEAGDDDEALQQVDQAALSAAIAEADVLEKTEELSEAQNEFRSNVRALKFSQSALDFIEKFEYANDACQGMLLSSNTSDVTEALRFFVRARSFQLPCAMTGMKQALALMWSSEACIREEVLHAFVEVFIAIPGTDGKENLSDNQIAHNLLVLVGRASVSELASIEEALRKLVSQERIPADVFLILWSIAAKAKGDARSAALRLLSMAASADRSIVDSASRLKLLMEAGLGDYAEERRDWKTATAAAKALQRISTSNLEPSSAKAIVLEQIIERLSIVVRGDWCVDDEAKDTLAWFSAAEQSIDALFVLSQAAEVECANIISAMAATTFGIGGDDRPRTCHSLCLARFFFVLGHIALKLLVYTEFLSGALRRANAMKSLKNQETADKAKSKNGDMHGGNEDAIEAELGVAAEVEAENERRFADISEKEILGRGLISKFTPLLVRVVGNEGQKFQSEILRQSASVALSKFMCISISFCEDHLPLIFTVLDDAPVHDTILRANTVVALGDHAFRFPNEVEPYTPRLYACLRDSSTKVRRHTLMVLTHLILNDMVKVKGQVCEIAMCLRDEDPRIVDMSRLLFFELSKRSNNPIYNLLPDIISKLSQQSMKQEDFRIIMAFLLAFIKKERQNEMLVEKLLHRFPKCESMPQKADLAFCIAQLKVNERSVKTLTELFRLYKDALFDDEVKKSFFSIVSRAKKFAKADMKTCLDEWEIKLGDYSLLGLENQAAGRKAIRAKKKAAHRAVKRIKQLAVVEELSFIEEDEDECNKENRCIDD